MIDFTKWVIAAAFGASIFAAPSALSADHEKEINGAIMAAGLLGQCRANRGSERDFEAFEVAIENMREILPTSEHGITDANVEEVIEEFSAFEAEQITEADFLFLGLCDMVADELIGPAE